MKTHSVTILRGDGIGPEIIEQAVKVLEACSEMYHFNLSLDYQLIGAISIEENGEAITDQALTACMNSDGILLGAIGDPKYDNDPTLKVRPEQGLLKLRQSLGLFANIRPVQIYPELLEQSPLKAKIIQGTNIVIYRELTGGIYFGEKKSDENNASDLCVYSKSEIERIAHLAFKAAQKRKGKLCLVDKANVMETSRLWRSTVQALATDYPDVSINYMFVDNAAMQLVLNPKQFDVILTENMFGDILSDLASVIPGSLGLLPSASTGQKTALFEPCHGSYPQAKGLDKANPLATILSAALLLEHLGETEASQQIEEAVAWCIREKLSTEDVNPVNPISCSMVGDLIALYIRKEGEVDINTKAINRETFYI